MIRLKKTFFNDEAWLAGYRCPNCDEVGHWRSGYEFEHQMRCFNNCQDVAPIWEPGTYYLIIKDDENTNNKNIYT